MIEAIIFDLWETLGTKNIGISKTLRERFGISKTPDFLTKYEHAIQLTAYGSPVELARNFLREFGIEPAQESVDFVTETLQQGIDKATMFEGMYGLIETLSKTYRLGILSNTTVFESVVPSMWGVEQFFGTQVYSWQLGSLKPSMENFKAVCLALQVKPENALFIDDGEKNVAGAKACGLKGIQYQDLGQLKRELVSLGVKIE